MVLILLTTCSHHCTCGAGSPRDEKCVMLHNVKLVESTARRGHASRNSRIQLTDFLGSRPDADDEFRAYLTWLSTLIYNSVDQRL